MMFISAIFLISRMEWWKLGIMGKWAKNTYCSYCPILASFRKSNTLVMFFVPWFVYPMKHIIFQPDGTQMYSIFHNSNIPSFSRWKRDERSELCSSMIRIDWCSYLFLTFFVLKLYKWSSGIQCKIITPKKGRKAEWIGNPKTILLSQSYQDCSWYF